MSQEDSLPHSKGVCKYHIRADFEVSQEEAVDGLSRELGPALRELARQRESETEEGLLLNDHVHILISNDGRLLDVARVTSAGNPFFPAPMTPRWDTVSARSGGAAKY